MGEPYFTGKRRFRRTLFGGLLLQVQVHYPAHDLQLGFPGEFELVRVAAMSAWRDAVSADTFALDLPDFEPRSVR